MGVRLRNITLLVVSLLWASVSMAQTVGDFKMDERELYAMTKQMGQFMRRFNYEEDQFGYRLNPKDPKYRSNEMRRKSLPILFDQQKYGTQTDLQRQPDGTYVGVITIFQTFRGYDKEGQLAYKDTTKKDITVYVKRKETQIGGRMIGFWDVLLGDMRVKETANK